MRIIYKVMLGMLIFNVLFLAFSSFFPVGDHEDFKPNDGSNLKDTYSAGEIDIIGILITGIGTFSLSMIGVGLIDRFTGASISISLGSMICISVISSMFSTIWFSVSGIISPILRMGDMTIDGVTYTIGSTFYTLFTIILGIVLALTLAEMFGGQSGVDM